MKKYNNYIKGKWIRSNIFILLYSFLISYKKKFFKIIFFEVYYSLKYYTHGKSFKPPHIHPCPYYFIHKVSQFINKKKINSAVDLGCGFGRLVNFLRNSTKANISGYEIDKEAVKIGKKEKGNNIKLKSSDILEINYKKIHDECFIINEPFYQSTKENIAKHQRLIKKIEKSKVNFKKKYYLITINVNEKRNYIYKKKKLIKVVFAGHNRTIKFYEC